MMPHNHGHLQLTLYADLTQFISSPQPLGYNRLTRLLDIVSICMTLQGIADNRAQVQSARRAMVAIEQRYARTGVLAVTGLDALTLRAAAPAIEAAIGRIRLDAFSYANALVQHKMQLQGVAIAD
ncbi:hypothetical protein [Cupriavidus plantarum]|uniref:hypothetical protein n=1 Tax=Cupriavidus plantarum TaxID=942865 RepID=UPI000EB4DCE4|nr:hypothetical protein [Cupriavidus plantarum]